MLLLNDDCYLFLCVVLLKSMGEKTQTPSKNEPICISLLCFFCHKVPDNNNVRNEGRKGLFGSNFEDIIHHSSGSHGGQTMKYPGTLHPVRKQRAVTSGAYSTYSFSLFIQPMG